MHPYKCQFCRENCLRDKQVVLQLGSNDLLKRGIPQYPSEPQRRTINVKWARALNIIMQKLRFSAVYEVILLDVPEFPYIDIPAGERYIRIKSRLNSGPWTVITWSGPQIPGPPDRPVMVR